MLTWRLICLVTLAGINDFRICTGTSIKQKKEGKANVYLQNIGSNFEGDI